MDSETAHDPSEAPPRRRMPTVMTLLACEVRKHARAKMPYIGLGAVAVMAALWPRTLTYYTDVSLSRPLTGFEKLVQTMQAMAGMLLPVFVTIFAATLVAGETSHRTLHYVLCRPISRMRLLTAKFLTALAYAALLLGAGAGVTIAVVAATHGYADLGGMAEWGAMRMVDPRHVVAQFWRQFALTLAMTLPPLFATAAFAVFFSVLFRNVGAAVGTAAGLLVALEPLKQLISLRRGVTIAPLVWSNYFSVPLELVNKFAAGTPNRWDMPETWRAMIIPAVWFVVFAAAAGYIMKRRDWA